MVDDCRLMPRSDLQPPSGADDAGILFAVLGPLEVRRHSGELLRLDQRKKRTLLLTLLLHPGRWVSIDEIRLALWQDSPPRSAIGNIKTYLSELRHTLPPPAAPPPRSMPGVSGPARSVRPVRPGRPNGPGEPGRIESRPGKYRLVVAPAEIDAARFEATAERGRAAARAGAFAWAAELFDQALGLWRGSPFDELPAEVGGTEVLRLEEARWAAREDLIDARLALGEYDEVLPTLRALTVEYPTRERLWAQLLLALERTGRRAEALAEYRTVYRYLSAELGIEPGAELRRIHQHVLDPDSPDQRPSADVRDRAGSGTA